MGTSFTERLKGWDPRIFDAVFALGVTALGVGSLFGSAWDDEQYRDTDVLAVLLALAITLPLYWRRRRPLPAVVVSAIAITALGLRDYRTGSLPAAVLFLVYAVAAYAPHRQAVAGIVATYAAILVLWGGDTAGVDTGGVVENVILFTGSWIAGKFMRARAEAGAARLAEAEEHAEVERQQAARSVAEERLRLAQELHDVVAHSMSVIAVQAGMGAHVIDTKPEEARRALEAISQTSRSTLNEMRRLLGVLRDETGRRANAPAPAIADIPRLVDDVRHAGIPVELTVEGDPGAVPQAVELSVYRLVQEGLTNVIKHAGKANAAVTIRCRPSDVEVEVVDDGRGAAANGDGSTGHGLVGMRERVALWGGTLAAGPRPSGGYRVLARIPYGEPS